MKIRAVHLLTDLSSERERRSIREVAQLQQFGVEYIQLLTSPWSNGLPPSRAADDRPFKLTKGHFGCWDAHRAAILNYLTSDLDALLVFECDALFAEPVEVFWDRVKIAYEACVMDDLLGFTFGPKHGGILTPIEHNSRKYPIALTTQFIETHAYLIPQKSKPDFEAMFAKPWDALDYCYTIYLYDQDKRRIGVFADRPASMQADGPSLVDPFPKTSENHFRNLHY